MTNQPRETRILLALAGLAVIVMAVPADLVLSATPPALVNYQGVLRDPATGIPMSGAYDAVFRFYSAATGGDEVLVDTHLAMANQGLSVANGLFSVPLGGGALTDGNGPGSYGSLDAVFRDYGSVWLEIEIQGQVLAPRVSVISSPYALNATNLDGKPGSSFIDTSSSDQTKTGPLTIYTGNLAFGVTAAGRGGGVRAYDSLGGAGLSEVGTRDYGIRSYGRWAGGVGMPGWFKDTQDSGEAWVAPGNNGIYAFGSDAGGIFRRGTPGSYTDEVALANGGFGVFARGDQAGGLFEDRQGTSQTWLAQESNGIISYGSGAGGIFRRGTPSSYTNQVSLAASGYGVIAYGDSAGGTFRFGTPSSFTSEASLASGGYGAYAHGAYAGGYFANTTPGIAYAELGVTLGAALGIGIRASGTYSGGIFTSQTYPLTSAELARESIGVYAVSQTLPGWFSNTGANYSNTYLANGWAIQGTGTLNIGRGGAEFTDYLYSGRAQLGRGDVGVVAYGTGAAGVFRHGSESGWDAYGHIAEGTASFIGNGAKSFVQNHPYDPDVEIVYAALEGNEVGTYTRGSAILTHGIARVKLAQSFAWVTNPDIGLTATVTPRGVAVPLAVESVSTSELVVRAEAGAHDVAFDYVVQGLRAGFERVSVVRPKRGDAPIPSMAEHTQVYAAHPEMQEHNALERFAAMPGAPGREKSVDLSRSEALIASIGVGDMNQSPVRRRSLLTPEHAAQWERNHPGESLQELEARVSERSLDGSLARPERPPVTPALTEFPAPASGSPRETISREPAPPVAQTAAGPPSMTLAIAEAMEPGDVVVNDRARPGSFVRGREAGDRGVIGIVSGEPDAHFEIEAPVAVAGVVLCKVDATEFPIEANDMLMASSLAGHAMRAGENPKQGTVIGKALEPLAEGTGVIKVLVMMSR